MVLNPNSSTTEVHSSNLNLNYKSRIFRVVCFLVDLRKGGWLLGWEVWGWISGTSTRLLELGRSALVCGVFERFGGSGPGTFELSGAAGVFRAHSFSAEEPKPLSWDPSFPRPAAAHHSWRMMSFLWRCDSRLLWGVAFAYNLSYRVNVIGLW